MWISTGASIHKTSVEKYTISNRIRVPCLQNSTLTSYDCNHAMHPLQRIIVKSFANIHYGQYPQILIKQKVIGKGCLICKIVA